MGIKWKFNCILEKTLRETGNSMTKAFFLDAEKAKEWLV